MQPGAVTRQAEQAFHHRAGVVQVGEGFEQRHHAHRPQHAGFLEQQLHGQHVGSSAGHGDHIRAQRGCWRCGNLAARGEHFGGVGLGLEVAWQQRATAVEFLLQEGNARVFIPLGIAAKAQVFSDFAQRRGVLGGVLTHIKAHQEQAEGHCPTQAIEQRAIGNHAHATGMQRFETQVQGFEQVAVVL
ncbi:hypothetical protein D3C79_851030 [compost metagenome]